ncbi:redoxin domain-containing protein [Sphingobacterium multivorum]|nr:TlpA disulfide reductase family protein [Sphingobacterium multivorum]QQT31916.1 redoxin domain-containing protein [Sphingobacterium multivorum]
MNQYIKYALLSLGSFFAIGRSIAQEQLLTLQGTVAQKKNYEIMIVGKDKDRSFRVFQSIVDTSSNQFVAVFPVKQGRNYSMRVNVMKEGHRRLEQDQSKSFPISPLDKKQLDVKIDPALFSDVKKEAGAVFRTIGQQKNATMVSGTLRNLRVGAELSFERVDNGQGKILQTVYIDKGDSTYYFAVPIQKEGLYYLTAARGRKAIYLKPGDDIQLDLDMTTGSEVLARKTTDENKMIAQWEKIKLPVQKALQVQKPDRDEFTQLYQPMQKKVDSFLNALRTANPRFDQLFRTAVKLDNNLLALQMLLKSSSEKRGPFMMPSKDFLNVPDYYRHLLQTNKVESADILQLSEGFTYLNLVARFSLINMDSVKRKQLDDTERVAIYMDAVQNEALKPLILKSQLDELEFSVANYSEFRNMFLPFKRYENNAAIKKKYNGILNMFVADTAYIGKSANTFTIPDMSGKMVSMHDFKGKVVLIDTWATWCGPCKAQIPFLKEVEEHYKGNDNIVFVGISIDAEKDKEKWLKTIKEKELTGIQLLDDKGKFFARKYNITAIPRFCLIDKEGNWAEIRCPLPEQTAKLIKYIDQLL